MKLWEVNTGRLIRTFDKLWEVNTGRLIRTFDGDSDGVFAVAFSPDGKTALSDSDDGTIRLWNLQTGEEIAKMVVFEDGEWVTLTSQGYYVASENGNKYINVRIGNQVTGVKVEQYRAQFNDPEMVKILLEPSKE